MQLTLTKRYSHGFQVSSNYTLSKVVGDFAGERQLTGGEIIPYFMYPGSRADVGAARSGSSSPLHDVVGDGPAGPEPRRAPLRWVLGGWQWSGVMQYQTGRPFTVTSGTDNSLDGIGNDRAKLTGADVERRADHALRQLRLVFQSGGLRDQRSRHVRQRRQGRLLRSVAARLGHGRCRRTSASTARRTCRRAWSSSTSSTR